MTQSPPSSDPEREATFHRIADRLTVLCGFSELLRDGAYGPLTPEQQRILDTLVRESREAGALFQLLLHKRGTK